MSADDFELLNPHLQGVDLPVRIVLEEPNTPFEWAYFPEPSLASVVAITTKGEKIEVGLFGPEGMSATSILQGADRSPLETFMQVAGVAYAFR